MTWYLFTQIVLGIGLVAGIGLVVVTVAVLLGRFMGWMDEEIDGGRRG